MPSNSIWLQIIFCSCVKETVLFSLLWSLLHENGRFLYFPRIFIKKKKQTRWSDDKTIIELGYLKISWFVSVSQINCLSLRLRQMIYCSARHRQSRYFAQPRPIIVNCFSKIQLVSQKYRDKTTLVSKTLFSRHCFGFRSWRFSLLVGRNI